MTTAVQMLLDIAEELRNIDLPYAEPMVELQPTDTVVVEEAPEDVKRLYTLQYRYTQQVVLAGIKYQATGVMDDSDRHAISRADILLLLMWRRIALEFPPEDREYVGIRKGWKLVKPAPAPPPDDVEPTHLMQRVN